MIDAIRKNLEGHLKSSFGIKPEESSLHYHDNDSWQGFCRMHGNFLAEAKGMYLMRNLSAHVLINPELAQTVFHEYFGHGLYAEHTAMGKRLHSLEKALEQQEKEAGVRRFQELKEFRKNSKLSGFLKKLQNAGREENEGFAMWMENYLSRQGGREQEWLKRFKKMQASKKILCKKFIDYEQAYGKHALLYSLGFPKHYSMDILESMLKRMFDQKKINFALLYGSRKPKSDIDVFMVTGEMMQGNFGWLDINCIRKERFEWLLERLDISVTDALFSGSLIFGNNRYFEQSKSRILKAGISREAIEFHRQHAKRAEALAVKHAHEKPKHRSAMQYSRSYAANAMELTRGNKILTFERLRHLHPRHFERYKKKLD